MRTVLFDTNVLIALEDPERTLLKNYADMLRQTDKFRYYIHPLQFEDINRDKNEYRRSIMVSRANRYSILESIPSCDDAYFDEQGWSNGSRNDVVDNNLLACVLNPYVNFLVTNDRRMHRKAARAGIADRVLTLDEFCEMATDLATPPELAYVKTATCADLDPSDCFFDSLRGDYPEFDNWLTDCALEHRPCALIAEGNSLRALCIFKEEPSQILDDRGFKPEGSIVKFCTFKVDESLQGLKIGERLLYQAFLFAHSRRASYVYFTVKEEKHTQLVDLALDFGFEKKGHYKDDRVMGKCITPCDKGDFGLDKLEFAHRFYPSFKDDGSVGKYLVPIVPRYHERLFPDISDFSRGLFGDVPSMYTSESNTIRKAYLCGAAINALEPGDLLLFYRGHDRQEVQAIGVVAETMRSNNIDAIIAKVKKRTVYREAQIAEMIAQSKNTLLTICFNLVQYLDKPVSLRQLRDMGISAPRTIRAISEDQYKAIMEAGT